MNYRATLIAVSCIAASALTSVQVKASTLTTLIFSNLEIAQEYDEWDQYFRSMGIVSAPFSGDSTAQFVLELPFALTPSQSLSSAVGAKLFVEAGSSRYEAFEMSGVFNFDYSTNEMSEIDAWEVLAFQENGFDNFTWNSTGFSWQYEYVLQEDAPDADLGDIRIADGGGDGNGSWVAAPAPIPVPGGLALLFAALFPLGFLTVRKR
ncbi:MAG: hypothetical protein AAF293_00220 [Pseudomonadota bacterium]